MRTFVIIACLFAFGCQDRPPQQAKDTPTPATAPGAEQPLYDDPNKDPEEGDFTLEEALAGLEGEGKLMAAITTSMGTIECELLPDIAPMTVANFVGLARGTRPFYDLHTGKWTKRPFYDGLIFHRVQPKFMIQGGDPRGTGREGPGYTIKDEFTDKILFDKPGRLAMAHTPRPNSGGSQFFITEVPYPSLNEKYAIMGTCGNLDVVKKIARVEKSPSDPERPAKDVVIEKIEIFRKAGKNDAGK